MYPTLVNDSLSSRSNEAPDSHADWRVAVPQNVRRFGPSAVSLGDMSTTALRLSYATRRVPPDHFASLLPVPERPQAGDIVMARLEKIGKNGRLELASGRNCVLHEGDVLAVVFGNRYATNQFEGYAAANGDSCDLMSMGGLCGLVASKHGAVAEPSRLKLLGLFANADGQPLHLGAYGIGGATYQRPLIPTALPPVTVVCGTSMDAGKTFTVTSLLRGMNRGNRRVASIKLTGTASGRDTWAMRDAGASPALDFIDGGFASTYMCGTQDLVALFQRLASYAAEEGAQSIVLEIADGLLQRETAALLRDFAFTSAINSWVLAASDSMGAVAGVQLLRSAGLEPSFVSGVLTQSPLGMRETLNATGVRCMDALELRTGGANAILSSSSTAAGAANSSSAGAPSQPVPVRPEALLSAEAP